MFAKAVKESRKARILLYGPGGSGKTFSALVLAKALAGDGRLAVIDTESASSMYADRFDFDVDVITKPYSPDKLTAALTAANDYAVVIVDSFSLFWSGTGGVLDIVDKTKKMSKGGALDAWKLGTPIHNQLLDALRTHPAHKIVTLRAKTDYAIEKDDGGKTRVTKLGLAPDARTGIEYEFDLVLNIQANHEAIAVVSHISEFADHCGLITEDFGRAIRDWFASGETVWERLARELSSARTSADLVRIGKAFAGLSPTDPRTQQLIEMGKSKRLEIEAKP